MERQIELETLAIMLGMGGYRGSSYTLQEEVRFLRNKLDLLKSEHITSNEFAVHLLRSIEFAKNQM